jgi:hypothetical protein
VSDRDIKDVLDRLVGSLDDEMGDWEEVIERLGELSQPVEERRGGRRRGPWPERRLLLLAAAVLVTSLAALTIASPWQRGPSILDRAAAAIPAPAANQVLHVSVVIRARLPCRLPKPPFTPSKLRHLRLCAVKGRTAVWLDGAPPHRFRVFAVGPDGRSDEAGGSVGGTGGLGYHPSENVLDPVQFDFRVSHSDLDPGGFVRAALASGRGRLDGSATIRGRKVLRIRVTAHRFGREVTDALYFVDGRTYRPVRIVFTPGYKTDLRGVPLTKLALGLSYGGGVSGVNLLTPLIFDFARYEYLPATANNRKLADIRAQHPHAKLL